MLGSNTPQFKLELCEKSNISVDQSPTVTIKKASLSEGWEATMSKGEKMVWMQKQKSFHPQGQKRELEG